MNPKEQWQSFYRHEYDNDAVPSMEGIAFLCELAGLGDRIHGFDDAGKDWFGVEWVKDGSLGIVLPDPTADMVLVDIADWREVVKWPDLDAYDFEEAARVDGLDTIDRENTFIYYAVYTGPFERLHTLMGFEEALVALMTDPEECDAFFDAFMDWRLRLLEKVKEYINPDVIMYHDDIGTQKNLFFSPDLWRHFFKPRLKQASDKAHELGMFFEYHSCGKIESIVAELVDTGIDGWQGQEINDVVRLKELTNGKLEYHTWPEYQSLVALATANKITEEEVRAYTRKNFIKNLAGGHYSPLVMPFGDWVTEAIFDETNKLCAEYNDDPIKLAKSA